MKKERLQELAGVQLNEVRDTFTAKGTPPDKHIPVLEQIVKNVESAIKSLRAGQHEVALHALVKIQKAAESELK